MSIDINYFITVLAQEVEKYQVPVVDLIAVQTKDPFKVLVATILSARTKDETTAKSSARLFKRCLTWKALQALMRQLLPSSFIRWVFIRIRQSSVRIFRLPWNSLVAESRMILNRLPGCPGWGEKLLIWWWQLPLRSRQSVWIPMFTGS